MLKYLQFLKKLFRLVQTTYHKSIGLFFRSGLSRDIHGSEYEKFLSQIENNLSNNFNSFQHEILKSRSLQESNVNSRNFPLLDTLNEKSVGNFVGTCIDIGSGTGWIANLLSDRFDRVIAIEPNSSAINISKQFFGNGKKNNIDWYCGNAEDVLNSFSSFNSPVFVVTGVVFSHLPNKIVSEILRFINENLPINSGGIFCEAWGSVRSEKMWHVRSPKWWENHLSNCELDFYGSERPDFPGEYLGFRFKKIQ